MPSAANGKSEKSASSEATDNTPIRQIMTIIEHKIRNLEKRKSKLTSYRDLQKTGKELNADQKIAVAKYDEVAQTLEFARDLSKQVTAIVVAADRDAKKQAKKEAWVRNAIETNKIRDVLLILDCLMQMGNAEARQDFLDGTNGATKLTEDDLRILDELYSEVTPKHEINVEGVPAFHAQCSKAAEHLYAIIDGKPKEMLGTTYFHIKELVATIHECGYFDKSFDAVEPENENTATTEPVEELQEISQEVVEPDGMSGQPVYVPPPNLPVPPAPTVVPAPAYPLRNLPPITLQEVEHAYFSQQYPQQRPISEVIGSQNFFFLQESEIDSPVSTPQPPQILNQSLPAAPIPSQTFTNQHYVQMPAGSRVPPEANALPIPQPHFAPPPDHPAFSGVPLPTHAATIPLVERHIVQPPPPGAAVQGSPPLAQMALPEQLYVDEPSKTETPINDKVDDDEWQENQSPEHDDNTDRSRTQGQGDGQNRFRRFGRGGGRGPSNGYRGRGGYQNRQNSDGYQNRHNDYQNRQNKDNYQNRSYNNDGYQSRHKDGYQNRNKDGYYGNGDTGNGHHDNNGTRDRNDQNYQGGFKSRGRGPRGTGRGAPRAPRPQHYRNDNVE